MSILVSIMRTTHHTPLFACAHYRLKLLLLPFQGWHWDVSLCNAERNMAGDISQRNTASEPDGRRPGRGSVYFPHLALRDAPVALVHVVAAAD